MINRNRLFHDTKTFTAHKKNVVSKKKANENNEGLIFYNQTSHPTLSIESSERLRKNILIQTDQYNIIFCFACSLLSLLFVCCFVVVAVVVVSPPSYQAQHSTIVSLVCKFPLHVSAKKVIDEIKLLVNMPTIQLKL